MSLLKHWAAWRLGKSAADVTAEELADAERELAPDEQPAVTRRSLYLVAYPADPMRPDSELTFSKGEAVRLARVNGGTVSELPLLADYRHTTLRERFDEATAMPPVESLSRAERSPHPDGTACVGLHWALSEPGVRPDDEPPEGSVVILGVNYPSPYCKIVIWAHA